MIRDHQTSAARLAPLAHRPWTWRRFRWHMIVLIIIWAFAFGAWEIL